MSIQMQYWRHVRMNPGADLHIHSCASDGSLRPAELMELAKATGMWLVALTDHDTCEGIEEAASAAERLGICFIPGIELSCGGVKEIHVLGYGVRSDDAGLKAFCDERIAERQMRAMAMMDALEAAGVPVDRAYVYSLTDEFIGRPHIARGLVQSGYAQSVEDAFSRYLAPGRPGYVPRREVSVENGCNVIRAAGGVPVLAHPMELRSGEAALSSLVHEWHRQGLAGMEIYHPSTANHKVGMLQSIARQEGLLVTGGSDYHGPEVRNASIGQGVDRWENMRDDLLHLFDAIRMPVPRQLLKPEETNA